MTTPWRASGWGLSVLVVGSLLNLAGVYLYLASGTYVGAFLSLGCAGSTALAFIEALLLRRRARQR